MENSSIVASGKLLDIGCRVILWNEPGGHSFYPTHKFTPHNDSFEQLQDRLKGFVLHHSVTYTAKHTFVGLNGRGLSVNFIIDDNDVNGNATIYQCLDIKDAGFSQGNFNSSGPGVEVSYMPQAFTDPHLYSEANRTKYGVPNHEIVDDIMHGQTRKVFAPTAAQINSMAALVAGYLQLFPKIDPKFPRDSSGNISKTVVTNPKGILLHANLTLQKIDLAGLDCDKFEQDVNDRIQVGF